MTSHSDRTQKDEDKPHPESWTAKYGPPPPASPDDDAGTGGCDHFKKTW